MNPIDEYLMAKTADEGGWKAGLRNAAITTGAGLAVAGAPVAAKAIYNAVAKRSRFNNMLANNEDLQAMHATNPAQFQLMFNSLHNMAPEYAADPLVAGAHMRKMMSNPAGAGLTLTEARSGAMKQPEQDSVTKALQGMAPNVAKDFAAGVRG
jgi:hypothetical protein